MKQNPPRLQPIPAFLILECAIYISFLTLDLLGRFDCSLRLKYSGILLCLAVSLNGGSKAVSLALTFTAAADWFLLIQNDQLPLGVVLFICVQVIYAVRLHLAGAPCILPLRVGLALVSVLTLLPLNLVAHLNLLALICFSQLAVNAALAWALPSMRQFAWGLTLLACCDLCVGLHHSSLLPPCLQFPVTFGMWLFYLPSQVLITLSARFPKEVPYENQ